MYMNLKPNPHKIISFNTTTMTSLGVHRPPPKILGPHFNIAKLIRVILKLVWTSCSAFWLVADDQIKNSSE